MYTLMPDKGKSDAIDLLHYGTKLTMLCLKYYMYNEVPISRVTLTSIYNIYIYDKNALKEQSRNKHSTQKYYFSNFK